MKNLSYNIKNDFNRDLYWIKVVFVSDDEVGATSVFACASQEYLNNYYCILGDAKLEQKQLEDWANCVVEKWLALGEDILKQDAYYDVYANTQEGEAVGRDFLFSLSGARNI